jgi:hypothetical protein
VVNNYEEDIQYLRDIAEEEYKNKFDTATLAPDIEVVYATPTPEPTEIPEEETEIEKAYNEFCKSWICIYTLKASYKILAVWAVDKIYFIDNSIVDI